MISAVVEDMPGAKLIWTEGPCESPDLTNISDQAVLMLSVKRPEHGDKSVKWWLIVDRQFPTEAEIRAGYEQCLSAPSRSRNQES